MVKYKGRKVRFGKRGGAYVLRNGRKEYLPKRRSGFGFWPFDGPSIFGEDAPPSPPSRSVSREEAEEAQRVARRAGVPNTGTVATVDASGNYRADPFWAPVRRPGRYGYYYYR